MPRLKLVTSPNRILRDKNEAVTIPPDEDIIELAHKMFFACKKFDGVGLAAPQIGVNLRMAVINLEAAGIKQFAILNPEILSVSKQTESAEEGCLSIPGKFASVERPTKIKVRFYNLDGKKIETEVQNFLARVFQHEVDHLIGTLIEDKWDPSTIVEDERKKTKHRPRSA